MKPAISTELTESNIALVLEALAATPGRLERLGRPRPEAQLRQPLGAGQRSFAEDLAHLVNGEARSSEAIYLALLAHEPELVALHPDRQLGKLLRFDRLTVADLLAYFKLRRTVLLRVLTSLRARDWSRAVREAGKQRQESVYWRARALALHEAEHLAGLEHKLAGRGEPDRS